MGKNTVALLSLLMLGACVALCAAEPTKGALKVEITDQSTIVCFGDSLTCGYGADSPQDSYPMVLQRWVKIPVINAGVNDDTTEGAKARFQRDVLDNHPAIILFDFGGNDLYNSAHRASIRQIEANFRSMLDQVDMKKTKVYVIRYYNDQMRFLDAFWGFDRMLGRLERDYDVTIIRDLWAGVWGKKELKFNMNHPNSTGYAIVAKNVFEAIKPALERNDLLALPAR